MFALRLLSSEFLVQPNKADQTYVCFAGHFAQDCFHIPGATTYELLPDVGFMMQQQAEEDSKRMEEDHKHHKKKKKEKKEDRKGVSLL